MICAELQTSRFAVVSVAGKIRIGKSGAFGRLRHSETDAIGVYTAPIDGALIV